MRFKKTAIGEYESACGNYRISKWVGNGLQGKWRLERLNRRKRTDPWETLGGHGGVGDFYFARMKHAVEAAESDAARREIDRMLRSRRGVPRALW